MADKILKPYKTPGPGVFNLRTGALHARDEVLIVAGLARLDAENTAHSIVMRWSGALPWHGIALNWSSGSCCALAQPQRAFGMLGIDGEFAFVQGDALSEHDIDEDSMSAIAAVGRTMYAVGAVGRVLRSEDGRSWQRLTRAEDVNDDLLEAVAAYTPDEIYAVGAEGAIVLLRPTTAERIDSPTNLVLSAVCRGPDDLVYACGQRGLILCGREHEWKVVEQDQTTEDFWDICTFQERIFLTSTHFLYELKDSTLETVTFEDYTPHTFCKLATAADDVMLSVGQADAFLFDGRDPIRLI